MYCTEYKRNDWLIDSVPCRREDLRSPAAATRWFEWLANITTTKPSQQAKKEAVLTLCLFITITIKCCSLTGSNQQNFGSAFGTKNEGKQIGILPTDGKWRLRIPTVSSLSFYTSPCSLLGLPPTTSSSFYPPPVRPYALLQNAGGYCARIPHRIHPLQETHPTQSLRKPPSCWSDWHQTVFLRLFYPLVTNVYQVKKISRLE